MEFTRDQLVEAFQKWNDEYEERPKDFNDSTEGKAENQAETLIKYLKQK